MIRPSPWFGASLFAAAVFGYVIYMNRDTVNSPRKIGLVGLVFILGILGYLMIVMKRGG
jgi:hypothetical protein